MPPGLVHQLDTRLSFAREHSTPAASPPIARSPKTRHAWEPPQFSFPHTKSPSAARWDLLPSRAVQETPGWLLLHPKSSKKRAGSGTSLPQLLVRSRSGSSSPSCSHRLSPLLHRGAAWHQEGPEPHPSWVLHHGIEPRLFLAQTRGWAVEKGAFSAQTAASAAAGRKPGWATPSPAGRIARAGRPGRYCCWWDHARDTQCHFPSPSPNAYWFLSSTRTSSLPSAITATFAWAGAGTYGGSKGRTGLEMTEPRMCQPGACPSCCLPVLL